ncbi:caspase family protein [Lewinella sp. IMCC34191]|uniref:DUF7379 domain-containing protein n=1 Tax=Lewinella sp. IMCC34191 TaxID=2259172 RepID=UPI000E254471|nr:caspase family protein [Lewinella sp. IMCC34191]
MAVLYGILVGIDRYPPAAGLASLSGCRNDIRHWQQILQRSAEGRTLNLYTFTDEEATYAALVNAFADVTRLITAGDHLCFVFCGHGSREPAAQAFRTYFPESLQETLVCFDSRLPGGLALADKELAWLLQDIADRGADITVVLDCCHSGSGTRNAARADGTRIRRAPDASTPRPLESYLGGRIARQLAAAGTEYRSPNPAHVLLSACDRREEATELPGGRGLLSSAVEIVLEAGGHRMSYLDLHRRALARVLGVTDRQHPTLEAVGGADPYRGFLGTAVSGERSRMPVTRRPSGEVSVPLGAVHGLAGMAPHDVRFHLFRDGEPWQTVSAYRVDFERTELPASLSAAVTDDLTATLISAPPPPAFVYCSLDAEWQRVAELAAETPSAFYTLSTEARKAAYRLEAYADGIAIVRQVDGARAYAVHNGPPREIARATIRRLHAIMEWEYLVALGNDRRDDATPRIAVTLELQTDDGWQVVQPRDRHLSAILPSADGQSRPLPFRIRVRNSDPRRRLYVSLFIGTEGYGFFDPGYHEALDPGETAIAWDTLPDRSPTRFVPSGQACTHYQVKCFVSEKAIDAVGLQRDGHPFGAVVDLSAENRPATRGGIPGLDGLQYRAPAPEWWGELTVLRVLETSEKIGPSSVSLLGGQLTVAPRQDSFSAAIVITTPEPSTLRAASADPLAEWLATAQPELLSFRPAGRGSSGGTVIELSEIKGRELLEQHPLELRFATQRAEEAYLQAFVHDGEHLLPVGEIDFDGEEGMSVLRISSLPETAGRGKRSAFGAVRMVIQKFVLRGDGYSLRWVDYSALLPRRRKDGLREKVASANRILLVVHGIIGDTRGMAAFCRESVERGDFDLVLTFDYENLATRLEDTSKALKKALQKTAGIREDQYLVILAHSMGGLVARHYIEHRSGNLYVDRLVMAGTPNAGSDIAKIIRYRKYAIALLGFAMNYGWATEALGILLAGLERSKFITLTLEQMDPDSLFLDSLQESSDPMIPYHVLAGDLNDFLDRSEYDRSLQEKLFKLGGRLLYGEVANDLAVTVESIHTVAGKRSPTVATAEIACHHMNYFVEPGSVGLLRTYLTNDKRDE